MDNNNFTMIEEVYGRAAAESVQKMLDIAQEAVLKMHDLYSKINALEADNARLRDALRPFADAWYSNVMEDDDPNTRIVTAYEWGTAHLNIAGGDYLEARHLRAAHLALNPDDTGGDADD